MKKNLILMCVLLVFLLTACSRAGAPEQIAAYSMEKPIAVYPQPPEGTLIYNATLDLEVSNVERATERDKTVPRYSAVARLDADNAAKSGGLTHGSSGFRAERNVNRTNCDERRRSTGRAARYPFRVYWMESASVCRMLSGRSHSEFIEVRLARQYSAGVFQASSRRGFER